MTGKSFEIFRSLSQDMSKLYHLRLALRVSLAEQVSAQTILKSLVKNLDVDIAHEMEVVAGKYLIQDGTLKVSTTLLLNTVTGKVPSNCNY
jgi:hypothetical protein